MSPAFVLASSKLAFLAYSAANSAAAAYFYAASFAAYIFASSASRAS
jgi:hypothetical protein